MDASAGATRIRGTAGVCLTTRRLEITRAQVLAYRRTVGALDDRLPPGADSLRHAAWAGLQDSVPRAALLSIHARVSGTEPSAWEDSSLVQLWGPRFSMYVVAAGDRGVFTLGRLPDTADRRRFAEDLASRLDAFLDGRRMLYGEAGRALGVHPNLLRYAAPTGRVLLRWDGSQQPTIWTVPPPDVDPFEACLELARRYLHVFGPTTAAAFGAWAGVRPAQARRAFDVLARSLTPVRTVIGDGWILAGDEPLLRASAHRAAGVRLLPSGDTYSLLKAGEREVLVPDARHRRELWTPRVWPGALMVEGELVGTWRRAEANVGIQPWRELSAAERDAVEAEAESLPLPGVAGRIRVGWGRPRQTRTPAGGNTGVDP